MDGAPDTVGSGTEPDISLWIKVVAQWLTFGFYFLVVRVNYNMNVEKEEDMCLLACEREEDP